MSNLIKLYKPDYRKIQRLNPVLYLDRKYSAFDVVRGNNTGQWDDLSGNNYHATQGTATDKPILSPEAVEFDGLNDYMLYNDSVRYNSDDIWSIYVEFDASAADGIFYNSRGSGGNKQGFIFTYTGTKLQFTFREQIITNTVKGKEYTVNLSGKNKIVGTYDGSEAASGFKLYLNGIEVGSSRDDGAWSSTGILSRKQPSICAVEAENNYFETVVSTIAIFEKELTSVEAISLSS